VLAIDERREGVELGRDALALADPCVDSDGPVARDRLDHVHRRLEPLERGRAAIFEPHESVERS